MQPPVFILGVSPRSGTNFLFDLLRLHPALDIPRTVAEDFLLYGAHHLEEYVGDVSRRWNMEWGLSPEDIAELLQSMGEAGLQFLRRRQANPERRLLTKTPEAHNLPLFFELFPGAQLIIIVRDGRAVVESKIKSFEAEFIPASRAWAAAAQQILDFVTATSPEKFRLVRYEDLYEASHETVRGLLEFLQLDPADYPFERVDQLPVRGSSVHFGEAGKLNWDPVKKTDDFQPLDRFSHWSFQQHVEFNVVAGEQMTRLGYELQEPVFVRANLSCAFYSDEADFITRLDTGARALMPRESADLLMSLESFQGLHQHFNQNELDPAEVPKFIEFYETCSSAGLLVSNEDFLATLRAPGDGGGTGQETKPAIFIRTCERPGHLERILHSLARQDDTAADSVFVLDDSRSPEARRANAGIVEKIRAAGEKSVRYLGDEWQRAFIARLASAFPGYAGVVRYLLEPRRAGVFSAGRVLNLAMLALAGRRLLTFDDDYIVDRCWQHPEADNTVLRISGDTAFCLQGYGSEEDMVNGNRILERDPLEAHRAVLGAPFHAIMDNRQPGGVRLEGLFGSLARRMVSDSRVLTTGNGIMGQPIQPDALQGWFAEGNGTTPVWAGAKDYNAWIEGNHVFSSHKSETIRDTTFGIPAGIDNSRIMPPTLPEGRREDTLFTFLLHHIHPFAVHFEFPWAIRHQREPLQWRQATVEKPQGMALAQFLMLSLQSTVKSPEGRGSPEAALMTLGATLNERSAQSDNLLRASVLSQSQWIASQHHVRLSEALCRDDLDAAVRTDMERALQVSQNCQVNRPAQPAWDDEHCPADQGARLQWVRENLMLFGQALLIWPVLWKYCKDHPEIIAMGEFETVETGATSSAARV